MPPLHPWLQRLIVAWAASTVTTGALLATAENRYRAKKAKKRRRRPGRIATHLRPPALPGTVARADAAEGFTPSLTWAEWFTSVQARGQRLLRFVTGQPPIGSVDDDGARLPDEVVTAGGQKVKVGKQTSMKAGAKKASKASKAPKAAKATKATKTTPAVKKALARSGTAIAAGSDVRSLLVAAIKQAVDTADYENARQILGLLEKQKR